MIPVLFALAGCFVINPGSDHITESDLAAAAAVPGVTSGIAVSLAPAPGVQRLFRTAELQRLAVRLGWKAAPEADVCFERPATALDPARMLEAMRRQLPEAKIEILDFSRWKAPEGELEFPASGLRKTPGGSIWNGWVRYAQNRRFLIWARVTVTVARTRVIAAEDLPAGKPIEVSALRVETREEFPGPPDASTIPDIVGHSPRHAIAAGTPISSAWLEARKDVSRGDRVRVEVSAGAARLELDAEAAASGATGQIIPVRNPDTRKTFPARIEGPGRVSVKRSGL